MSVEAEAHLPPDDAALFARYGRYPATVRRVLRRVASVGAGGPSHLDAVLDALLERSGGDPDGLTLTLLERHGAGPLATAVARCLRRPVAEVAGALAERLSRYASAGVRLTGAEAVALVLAQEGVTTAFAYAGTSELALCDSLARMPGVRLVNGRGDTESAFLAAGACLCGTPGAAAVLHGARGLGNAAGALADARRNEIGMVVVVGLPSTASARFLPPHGEPDLARTAGAAAKWWHEAPAPAPSGPRRDGQAAAFVAALRAGIRQARVPPRGPALFGLPQDVAESAWVPRAALDAGATPPPARRPAAALVDGALGRLARGRRPVVLVDDYLLRHDGAKPALAEFAGRAAAPVLQVRYRRGPMLFERLQAADVPAFRGWYDPERPGHRAALASADLLVTVEDRNLYPRVLGSLPRCPKIAITSDAAKPRKNGYLGEGDLLVEGDVVAVLRALNRRLAPAPGGQEGTWADGLLEAPTATARLDGATGQLRAGLVGALADALRAAAEPFLVDDSQTFGGLVCEHYDLLPPGVRVFGDHGGFVGGGISQAAGLAIANPSARVFCLLGDQAFTNGLQGLVAVAEQRVPVVYLVCNNGRSVSLLAQSADTHPEWFAGGGHPHLHNPPALDYAAVAGALGVGSCAVELPARADGAAMGDGLARLRARLREAAAARGPALVELRLPADDGLWGGLWRSRGFEVSAEPAPGGAGHDAGAAG